MKSLISVLVVIAAAGCASSDGGGVGGGSGGGAGGGSGGGTSGHPSTKYTCSSGSIFAGNPLHNDPMLRPAEGTGIKEDPPFPYRTVLFSSGQMITHDGQEIWRANLTDGKLHKIAGLEAGQGLITGPCASARFSNIFGIALAKDGSLFISDQTANTILKMTDPLGAGCMVSHYAGTPGEFMPGDIGPNTPPNVGEVEGAGATAKFKLPERMALDGDDNIYVWDHGNDSIRKIASDSAHTVSTLWKGIGGAAVLHEVVLKGKLYVWGILSSDVLLAEVDLATGAHKEILKGRASLFGGNSSDSLDTGGLATDGNGLILAFKGQIFYVDTNGTIYDPLAGIYAPGSDYSSGYDPKVSHTADKLEFPASFGLIATDGASNWLTLDATGNLYYTADADNSYVAKLDCVKH